ncbi:MAG: hypothetical protein O2999_15165, partial [Nitrospirae bacterium]|nr:hypothetical protein [Nitrospirota bacterium]
AQNKRVKERETLGLIFGAVNLSAWPRALLQVGRRPRRGVCGCSRPSFGVENWRDPAIDPGTA